MRNAHLGKGSFKKKKILQLSLDEVLIKEWESITKASAECNIPLSNISLCCNNKQKSSCGFKWKFK